MTTRKENLQRDVGNPNWWEADQEEEEMKVGIVVSASDLSVGVSLNMVAQ